MENDSEIKTRLEQALCIHGWWQSMAAMVEEGDLESLPMISPKIAISFIKPEVILTASVFFFLASSCHWALYP